MVRATARALALAEQSGDLLLKNMALESFLVHARNIRDFFGTAGKDDDVLVADFMRSPPGVKMPLLRSKAIRVRLNRRIAHLSFSRSRLKNEWAVGRLLKEIDTTMSCFVEHLRKVSPMLASIVDGA